MDQSKDNRSEDTPSDEGHPPDSQQPPTGAEPGGTAPASPDGEKVPPPEQEHSVFWYAAWAAIVAVPVGVLTAIAIAVFGGGSEVSISADSPRNPRLERVDLIARNPVPSQEPGLELLVRNSGSGRSVISRAQLEILRVYPLPLCFAQGDLSLSGRYGVELPPTSEPGEVVEVPLHQQLGGNEADRFRIKLETRPREESGLVNSLYLFEVAVALVHDGRRDPLPMGTALISLPAVPGSEFLLGKGQLSEAYESFGRSDLSARETREEWAPRLACWQENGRAAALARRSSATRSPDLEATLASAGVPSFAEIED